MWGGIVQSRLLRTVIGTAFSALSVCTANAQAKGPEKDACANYTSAKVPKFKIVRRYRSPIAPALKLYVTVPPTESDRSNLLALSCKIGRDFAAEDTLFVLLFDTERAARRWVSYGDPGNDRATEASYLGMYSFSRGRDSNRQALDLKIRKDNSESVIEIDLGPPPQRSEK
jgi:hypothetical protein